MNPQCFVDFYAHRLSITVSRPTLPYAIAWSKQSPPQLAYVPASTPAETHENIRYTKEPSLIRENNRFHGHPGTIIAFVTRFYYHTQQKLQGVC
jgi:hypothetical protein